MRRWEQQHHHFGLDMRSPQEPRPRSELRLRLRRGSSCPRFVFTRHRHRDGQVRGCCQRISNQPGRQRRSHNRPSTVGSAIGRESRKALPFVGGRMKKVLAILTMILWTATAWAQAPLLGAPRLNGHFTVQQSTVSLLRSSHSVRLQVPLAAGEFGDAELTRFDIWNGTVIERNGAKEKEKVSPPDTVYFRGTLVDNPDSWVFLAVEQHSTHGIVNTGSKQYQFGPTKPDGTDHVAREANLQRPASYKHNYPLVAPVTPEEKAKVTRKVKLTGPVTANVAIETDNELWTKFGSDAATLKYIGDLVGAANVIYNRDVQVTLNIGYVSLWPSSTPDPWKTTTSSAALPELITYWKT